MSIQAQLDVYAGDTFLSPTWAVVINGASVDLTDGWTVRAVASRGGVVVANWSTGQETPGASVVLGTADVTVGPSVLTTSTLRLYLTPLATDLLPDGRYRADIEITNPTFGPLGDLYRVTLVTARITVTADALDEVV